MALLRADTGIARIAGLDCWQQSVEIKRLIGYVPGEPALDPNLTGGQILEYFGHLRGGVDQAHLKRLIERFDLDPNRKFRKYSTGNKRKVVLIQAFMHRPRVLILDEPTSGLDPLNQQQFDAMVKDASDEGCTVFLSSHVLSEVEKTCVRVGIIREGKIVRIGGVHELKDIKRFEITLTFADAVPAQAFKALEGVTEVESLNGGHSLRVTMQGAADPVGGYATFKIGVFVFLVTVWPLLAASRMLRGEEDRGSLDVLLSTPRARIVVVLEKVGAMWAALLAIGLISGLIAYLGGLGFKAE